MSHPIISCWPEEDLGRYQPRITLEQMFQQVILVALPLQIIGNSCKGVGGTGGLVRHNQQSRHLSLQTNHLISRSDIYDYGLISSILSAY